MMAKIATLVYSPLRKKRKDNSFLGNDNVGARIIEKAIEEAGHEMHRCPPERAAQYDIVLVPFGSTYDVMAFYRAVALLDVWQPGKRRFVAIGGGFGMQNPTVIRKYLDYAAFGRAHTWIADVVDGILRHGGTDHESVMVLPEISKVVVSQAPLYCGDIGGGEYRETFTGCPWKCRFCHFSFSRRYDDSRASGDRSYTQTDIVGGASSEMTWDQLFTRKEKIGRGRTAIDGFSERLRYIYGKRISDEEIVGGVEAVGRHDGTTILLVYNICNFPSEAEDDRERFYSTIRKANPKNRVVFVLHSTSFRPSLLTPMQWEAVSLFPDWSKKKADVVVDRANLRVIHGLQLETPYSHLMTVVCERATTETDALWHAMAFAPRLTKGLHRTRLKIVQNNFDLVPYLEAKEIDASAPFLESYIGNDVVARMARKMRRDMKTAVETGKLPGGKTLVEMIRSRERTTQ